jgi:diguanylate cyclase
LMLEVAEPLALDRNPVVQSTLAALQGAGFGLAVSGLGARGLPSLPRLPVVEVWLDRALVSRLRDDAVSEAGAHAEAVVKLAQALGKRVVAEGVDLPAQRDALLRLGCDALQGRLLARPMSASALGLWLLDEDRIGADPSR